MASDEQRELNDSTYKALGHFVVAFSGVLYSLETSTIYLLGISGNGRMLVEAALTDRTAAPIVSSFFSVFHARWGDVLTKGDKQIMKCLRRELNELVRVRNRLMHDAWMSSTIGGDPGPHPLSGFRVRAHGEGVNYETTNYHPNDLEALIADAKRLSSNVNGTVWYQRPGQIGPELDRRFHIADGKVLRHEQGVA